MAITTYKTYLMYKSSSSSSYEKLIDIKSFPDLGGTPETLDTTTLSDYQKTSALGIQSMPSLEFDANYSLADFTKLNALKGQQLDFAVWFGATGEGSTATPNGTNGKYKFKGELVAYPTGGGVNEIIGLKITIAASTPIELDT